jgi:3-dehydroquinate synthase
MAYSATLANIQGLLSDEEMKRIHTLFSRCGLSMDHHDFNEDILDKATQAILKTRDGKLRAAVPNPLGSCAFINDIGKDELAAALRKHKELMKGYPRNGEGLEAFVDASDTGYTMNNVSAEQKIQAAISDELKACVINDDVAAGNQNGGLGANNLDGVTGGPEHAKALRSTASPRTASRTALPALSTATAPSTAMPSRAADATRLLLAAGQV